MNAFQKIQIGLAILVVCTAPSEARDRPRKPLEHYTFSEKLLAERVEPFRGTYDRVVLRSESLTRVSRGELLCRIEWTGRRVDYFSGAHADSVRFGVRLPRGSEVTTLTAYRIDADGKSAERIKDIHSSTSDDSLYVTVARNGSPVVDLQYKLDGAGVTVDETFPFTLAWPVIEGHYRFSVSRALLQEAADRGLSWDFSATTRPRVWPPTTDDDPEFFSWYWRVDASAPVIPDAPGEGSRVSVLGFLPDPVLAGIDPDELPKLESLADVRRFEDRLVEQIRQEQAQVPGGGGLTSRGGNTPVEVPTGPTKR